MTNKIAIILALIIVGVLIADVFVFEWDLYIFLGRKLAQLLEWMAFWR